MNKKFLVLSLVTASVLNAAGFKINEQSNDGVALASANIAKGFGADVAYYNPANMAFLPNDDKFSFENSFSYIQLNKIKFQSNNNVRFGSKIARVAAPLFHAVSPVFGDNWRFGVSFTAPAGMIIRWQDPLARQTAAKFELKVLELSPSLSYKFNDQFAIGFGLRAVYSKGNVINEGLTTNPIPMKYGRDIAGDSLDYGYNLALTYRPIEDLSLAIAYRSKVTMTITGNENIRANALGNNMTVYQGGANISAPLPAILDVGLAYTIDNTTLMFDWQKTYWSAWKEMDFNYSGGVNSSYTGAASAIAKKIFSGYDRPRASNWRDTNAFRIGVAHNISQNLRIMAGFAIDEAASMSDKTGFDVPDTKSRIYTAGLNYKFTKDLEVGLSGLYQDRYARSVNGRDELNRFAYGKFERAAAYIINLGVKYQF